MLARLLAAAVAAAVVAAPAAAAETSSASSRDLGARLHRALAVPNVPAAGTAALAVDVRTGEVVYARNPARPLAPASTEKLAVTYAALVRLGPTYRIATDVLGTGAGLDGDTWRGDVVLRGHGDPTLSSGALTALAARVRAFGIRRVTGAVVGDESFFDGRRVAPGWKRSYYVEESPPLSALVVDRARYAGRRVAYRPALVAAQLFRRALVAAGVRVDGTARVGATPAEAQPLARTASAPLGRLLRAVNRESDNFAAELLLKHLGAVELGVGSTEAGGEVVRTALEEAGIPLRGVRIADGSGLSLLNRLTADTLVGILLAAWDDPLLRGPLLSSLAVAGKSGTLRARLRRGPVAGTVFAKTGTTARASTLAGYVGDRYAFAVLQNGSPVSSWWARLAQDRFVTALATG